MCPEGLPLIHSLVLNHPPFLYEILAPLLNAYITHVSTPSVTLLLYLQDYFYKTKRDWIANRASLNAMPSMSLPVALSGSSDTVDLQTSPSPSASSSASATFIENVHAVLLYLASLSRSIAAHVRTLLLDRNILPSIVSSDSHVCPHSNGG